MNKLALPFRDTSSVRLINPVILACLGISLALGGCAAPPRREVVTTPPLRPMPSTQVFFYPTHGQSAEQQDRDRYECHQWAVTQSGFDPSQARAPHQRIEVVPGSPPGANVAAGAITGAVVGSILSSPRHAGAGALFGAAAGAVVGASADASAEQQAAREQQHLDARDAHQQAALDLKASNYRRAMSACLEGRGYSVQ